MWDICRTCMSKEKELISIFSKDKSPSINAMIMAITSLEFLPNDTLPSQICVNCFETIEITYYFKEQVIRCNNALQKQAQIPKLLAQQQRNDDEDVKRQEEDYFYNEQNEYITIVGPAIELSTTNVISNSNDSQSKCSMPELESMSNDTYNSSSESDVKSLNIELPLSSEAFDGNLCEESSDIKIFDSCFKDTCIKSEDVDVEEHGVQFEDNCEVMPKTETDNDEFSTEDDLTLQQVRVSTGSCLKSRHVQQNSNKNGEAARRASAGLKRRTPKDTPKSHKCEVCRKSFSWASRLKIHMRRHTGERPFKCQQCNAGFTQICNLKNHMRLHTGVAKPHTCEVCGNGFAARSYLTRHMRSHTHEKPFKCQYCNAGFSLNNDLKRHIRLHTGEATPKPHKCGICGKSFVSPSKLNMHMRSHAH